MPGSIDIQAIEADAEKVWAADAAIRAEFGKKATYVAYRRAEAQGRARILGQKAVRAEATTPEAPQRTASDAAALADRQAQVRQANVARAFAGLEPLPIPQE